LNDSNRGAAAFPNEVEVALNGELPEALRPADSAFQISSELSCSELTGAEILIQLRLRPMPQQLPRPGCRNRDSQECPAVG